MAFLFASEKLRLGELGKLKKTNYLVEIDHHTYRVLKGGGVRLIQTKGVFLGNPEDSGNGKIGEPNREDDRKNYHLRDQWTESY